MGDGNNASIGGKGHAGEGRAKFLLPQHVMPKMENKNQELALSACYLEIYQMTQLKLVALGPSNDIRGPLGEVHDVFITSLVHLFEYLSFEKI